MKPRLVVLSGAGMSAESGLRTFRDNGGLWEDHRVEDVATPEAWEANRALVLESGASEGLTRLDEILRGMKVE